MPVVCAAADSQIRTQISLFDGSPADSSDSGLDCWTSSTCCGPTPRGRCGRRALGGALTRTGVLSRTSFVTAAAAFPGPLCRIAWEGTRPASCACEGPGRLVRTAPAFHGDSPSVASGQDYA